MVLKVVFEQPEVPLLADLPSRSQLWHWIHILAKEWFIWIVLAVCLSGVGWYAHYSATEKTCTATVDPLRAEELLEKNGGPPIRDANHCVPDSYFR